MSDGWIADAVADGGYAAVGGLTVLENLVPPIPSDVVLRLAGFAVAEGTLGRLVPGVRSLVSEPVIGLVSKITLGVVVAGLGGYVVWRRPGGRRQFAMPRSDDTGRHATAECTSTRAGRPIVAGRLAAYTSTPFEYMTWQ